MKDGIEDVDILTQNELTEELINLKNNLNDDLQNIELKRK